MNRKKKPERRVLRDAWIKNVEHSTEGIAVELTGNPRQKTFTIHLEWWAAAELVQKVIEARKNRSRYLRDSIANMNKRFGIE